MRNVRVDRFFLEAFDQDPALSKRAALMALRSLERRSKWPAVPAVPMPRNGHEEGAPIYNPEMLPTSRSTPASVMAS